MQIVSKKSRTANPAAKYRGCAIKTGTTCCK
jgi:hypothetical protein